MPLPEVITGATIVSVGYTITLSDATSGGVWSSSDTSLATVGADTGIVTGVAVGQVTITYTTDDGISTHVLQVYPVTISNGFNLNDLFPVMRGRIGWLQSTVSGMPTVNADNVRAISGRYYNDMSSHVAVTIENLLDNQQDTAITDDNFNTLLETLDKSVIMRSINAVFNRPALLEKALVYTRTYNTQNIVIANQGKFVGYRINIGKGNYAVNFDTVSLYFDGVAAFNLYMFNDLLKEPVKVKEVTSVANGQTRVKIDWLVNYVSLRNLGGVVFIGYFQDDLGDVHALDEQLNQWSKTGIFGAIPFSSDVVDDTDFNRTNPSFNFRTYGMNLEVSAYRDYTQTIIENAHLFDEVRLLTMAITVLSIMKYTGRNNGAQRDAMAWLQQDLKLELDQAEGTKDFPYVAGLKQQLFRAYSQLNDNFFPKQQAGITALGGNNYAEYLGMNMKNLPRRQY